MNNKDDEYYSKLGYSCFLKIFEFLALLTIAFVVLRLCEVINWAWWLVLSPVGLPIGIILVVLISSWVVYIIEIIYLKIKGDKK